MIAERVVINSGCYANVDRRLCISFMELSEKPKSFENYNRRSASDQIRTVRFANCAGDPFARQVHLGVFHLSHNHRVTITLTYTSASDVIPIAFRVDVRVDRLESFPYFGLEYPGASDRPTRSRRLDNRFTIMLCVPFAKHYVKISGILIMANMFLFLSSIPGGSSFSPPLLHC